MQTATQLYKVDVELYDYKVHKKIVDIVKPKLIPVLKSYNQTPYKVNGSLPKGLMRFDDVDFNDPKLQGATLLLSVPVSKIRTLTDTPQRNIKLKYFQRPIKIQNCIKFINDDLTGEPAGFSYDYCGILEGTLFYDEQEDEWYIFMLVGQHRTAMAYLVGGEDFEVPVKVFVRDASFTDEQNLINDARRHFVDATKRTGQNQVDKISSATFSGDKDIIELLKFYDECKVSVGTLLSHEKHCESWGDIFKAINEYGRDNLKECMSTIAKYAKEDVLHAKTITSLARVRSDFSERVEEFERKNSLNFVDTLVDYVLKSRHPLIVSLDSFTKYSGKHKDTDWQVACWIHYMNEMVLVRDYKRDNKAKLWITKNSIEWKNWLDKHVAAPFQYAYDQRIDVE
jgi:hypothetical protein